MLSNAPLSLAYKATVVAWAIPHSHGQLAMGVSPLVTPRVAVRRVGKKLTFYRHWTEVSSECTGRQSSGHSREPTAEPSGAVSRSYAQPAPGRSARGRLGPALEVGHFVTIFTLRVNYGRCRVFLSAPLGPSIVRWSRCVIRGVL